MKGVISEEVDNEIAIHRGKYSVFALKNLVLTNNIPNLDCKIWVFWSFSNVFTSPTGSTIVSGGAVVSTW